MCPVFSLAHVGALDNTALLFQLPFLCPLFSSITLVVLICGLISYLNFSLSLSQNVILCTERHRSRTGAWLYGPVRLLHAMQPCPSPAYPPPPISTVWRDSSSMLHSFISLFVCCQPLPIYRQSVFLFIAIIFFFFFCFFC